MAKYIYLKKLQVIQYLICFHFRYCLAANAISVVILTTKEMRNSFNSLLAALCSFDAMYLLTATLVFGLPQLNDYYKTTILPWIMPIT